jgi:hypothetical protein
VACIAKGGKESAVERGIEEGRKKERNRLRQREKVRGRGLTVASTHT